MTLNINSLGAINVSNPRGIVANEWVDFIYISSSNAFSIVINTPTKLSELTNDSNYYKNAGSSNYSVAYNSNSTVNDSYLQMNYKGDYRACVGYSKSANLDSFLSNEVAHAYIGITDAGAPYYCTQNTISSKKEIALKEDVVKLSSTSNQTITNTGSTSSAVLSLKSNYVQNYSTIEFKKGDTVLGYFGFNPSGSPCIYDNTNVTWRTIPIDNPYISVGSSVSSLENAITSIVSQVYTNGVYYGLWDNHAYFIGLLYKLSANISFGLLILDNRSTYSISCINGNSSYSQL